MATINLNCPAGTSGLAVEPWSKGEIYAVAADWSQAGSPVYTYGDRDWHQQENGMQVADFRHSARAALEREIRSAIQASEGIAADDVDDDEVENIMDDAQEIDDTDAE